MTNINLNVSGEVAVAASHYTEERDYWVGRLAGDLVKSHFPIDRKPEEEGFPIYEEVPLSLSGELVARLMKLRNQSDPRLFMVLAAALAILLNKYNRRGDILFGIPVLKQEGGDSGSLLNRALAMRLAVEQDNTFKELLLQAKDVFVEANKNQNYPIQLLPQQLELGETGDGFSLFDVGLVLENIHEKGLLDDFQPGIVFSFLRQDDQIQAVTRYDNRRYDAETVERVTGHFSNVLAAVLENVDIHVSAVSVLSDVERRTLLVDFNDTAAPYPKELTLQEVFEEQVEKTPDAIAVFGTFEEAGSHGGGGFMPHPPALTYTQLNQKANCLGNYLAEGKGIRPDQAVGILMDNSIDMVVSILGVLKSGGAYVPLSPTLPEDRLTAMIDDAEISVILGQKQYIRTLNRLQWICPTFTSYLCVDSWDVHGEEETEKSQLMDEKLWEYVGEKAEDDIAGGGWASSYTGENFSKEEMDEYADNVYKKLSPVLHKEMRVLEIGCASGITMFRVAPEVAFYYGTDLSSVIIEKNKQRVADEGIENIALAAFPAHEIDQVDERDFDLVIINSVIQSFHGHNYLRQVLAKVVDLLKDDGAIFIGDIMDQDLRPALIKDLKEFKKANRDSDYTTKTDWSAELFVSRGFFEDLRSDLPAVRGVAFSTKMHTIENELTKFRYDAMVTVKKGAPEAAVEKHKFQEDQGALDGFSIENPEPRCTPTNLAYILFTSGTLGKPKGVMIEHRGVVNYITWAAKTYIKEDDETAAFPLHTSVSFDLTVTSIFTPLFTGNSIVVVRQDDKKFTIETILDESNVNVVKLTPSHLKLIRERKVGAQSPLRRFIVGGEDLEVRLAKEITDNFEGGVEIYNEYGPTEAVVGCMIYRYDPEKDLDMSVPIGVPADNARIYLLDGNLEPVPIGVPGEMYIGGDGVGRGYLKQPELTAEKFVADPFGEEGARMYRTGDLARRLPDGNIVFLGRIDQQVQIRGFRVELGEIEDTVKTYQGGKGFHWVTDVDISGIRDPQPEQCCSRCGLPPTFPSIQFDEQMVCNTCREFDSYKEKAMSYFRSMEDFNQLMQDSVARKTGAYDCLLLYSGGKDSTYVLFRLVEMGFKVLTMTFDNDYISEVALDNIKRITHSLQVDHITATAEHMKEVFVESLRTDHDVCNGCFKAVNTYGIQVAREKGIPLVFSGMSRGQIFDIKLHGMFKLGIYDADKIEEQQLVFRKEYHSMHNRTARLLGVDVGEEDVERIQFIDFFRYDDTPTEEVKAYLKDKDKDWKLPTDTGFCSTNCIINDVGIYVHLKDKGYHNYAAQLCWDSRLGLITRDQAVRELKFEGNPEKIRNILKEIGYLREASSEGEATWIKDAVVIDKTDSKGDRYLCAYVVPSVPGSLEQEVADMREHLSGHLPDYMMPAYFVEIDKIPLTPNGKLDRNKLPQPDTGVSGIDYIPPKGDMEKTLVEIWSEILEIEPGRISVEANFFELGGHSLKATILISKIHSRLSVEVPLGEIFKNPTVRGLAQFIATMETSSYTSIVPAEVKPYYDLSYAQRRLWILCQFEEDSTAYNMPNAFVISSRFDIEVFRKAVQTFAQRHESLRTVFITVDGEPRQKIVEDFTADIETVDLRHLSEDEQARKGQEIYQDAANKAFDLEKGPLFYFKLLQMGEDKYLFIMNIHHIINDGWSQGIIRDELFKLYNSFLNDQPDPLEPLRLQYKDYSEWHNRLIRSGRFNRSEQYWLEKFADKPNGLELPYDHSRRVIQTFNGGKVRLRFNAERTERFNQLCYQADATLFMGLLSFLSVFLHKYTGQQDIVVGSPIAGRKQNELHLMIGFLVNTIVFRNQLDPQQSFVEMLRAVRQETLDSYEYQDYPFDLLVERLELERDLSQSPLFNVMLAHNNADMGDGDLTMEGVAFSDYAGTGDYNMSKFDLTFFMDRIGSIISVNIEYNSDLFERESVIRMADNMEALFDQILENSDAPIKEIGGLAEKELQTVTQAFNQTQNPFPTHTLQEMFQQQADTLGDKTAVLFNGETLSYRQLNEKANRLAHYLREQYNVKPNDIIGVSMDRSIDMIVVLMGIIKSGAGYLAVDPTYPRDRVLLVLSDSRAQLLVIDKMRPQLFDDYTGTIIEVGDHWPKMETLSAENPEVRSQPTDILYVNYTSGTTGTPNGALLSHDLLTNLILWQKEKTTIDGSLRCLQFTSINFCVSFQEIMGTLVCGGELHLIGDIERQDIDYLMDFLVKQKIEVLFLPFSYLNFLFNESGRWHGGAFEHHLKHIITAGEQLKITTGLKRFLDENPHLNLHNHYGSTEMHVVTSYTLDASTAADTPVPPAGKPISNINIYILDEFLNPVPVGVWGELFVRGNREILGYIYNPALTDQKLVSHPEFSSDGVRLYRTGDVGRWMPDGNIELSGRKDSLVKIRGFRIEPGEVESKILSIDGIRDCVIVVKDIETGREKGQKYLLAYLVVEEGNELSDIKRKLAAFLPQYMMPKLVTLEALPLMPNGKVDRARLPEPDVVFEDRYVAPANEVEEKLAAIWAEILEMEVEKVGVESSFFELGGHSLRATRVISRIHQELNVKVPLVEIFKTPTVRAIGAYIAAADWVRDTGTGEPGTGTPGESEEIII